MDLPIHFGFATEEILTVSYLYIFQIYVHETFKNLSSDKYDAHVYSKKI